METDYNKGIWRFLDYDKFIRYMLAGYIWGIENKLFKEDIKMLISDINIRRIQDMLRRSDSKYFPTYFPSDDKINTCFGIKIPSEQTYPYNDKIILYTDNSCYPNGVIFEIDTLDIEVDQR